MSGPDRPAEAPPELSAVRRRARAVALMALYLAEQGLAPDAAMALDRLDEDEGVVTEPWTRAEVLRMAGELVTGVRGRLEDLDRELAQVSEHWRLERMSATDRNVLRLGAYEVRARPDVPAAAAIDEAVELARAFGTADSGAFVNGILDRVRERAGRTPRGTGAEAFEPGAEGA